MRNPYGSQGWSSVYQAWWQGPSLCVLANFVCQLDCIWNHLKRKLLGTLVRYFCNWIVWSRKTHAKSGPLKSKGEGNFDFCLLALTLTGKWSTPLLWLIVKPTSSGSQHRLKSSGSPGILQDSSASLEQQETCTPKDWSTFGLSIMWQPFLYYLDHTHDVSQSNKWACVCVRAYSTSSILSENPD